MARDNAPIDTVLFDLDGTLLDTLDDLAASANFALATCGYPTVDKEVVRQTVGNGALRLLCDLAGIPADADSAEAKTLLASFMEHYKDHCADGTKPFPGIMELLADLQAIGIKVGVVSNKPDGPTKQLCARYFGDKIDFALGSTPKIPRKPSPEPLKVACAALETVPEHTAYVGDSEPDVLVARNAKVAQGIAVTWGFRTRQQLEAAGARLVVDTAGDILHAVRH